MRTLLLATLLAGIGALPAPAPAASIGVTGGTLGVGPEVAQRFTPLFAVRVNATFLNISHGFDSSDVDYRGKVKLGSVGLIGDIHPFLGGFRISGGVRYNNNKARATATPTASTEIGGQTFTPTQIGTLRGRAEVKDFAPQATIGYQSGGLLPGFRFGIEAGALFQGTVKVKSLTSSGGGVPQARLDAERRDLQDDVDDYKVYPILQISLGFAF
jgi:hypothetical protein